jgi:hypothetical protein
VPLPRRVLPTAAWIAAIVVAMTVVLLGMGREPICTCGDVKLWHGVVFSAENSQHLTDWYSFTHIVHGLAFFALLRLVARRTSTGTRAILATLIEASWEVIENTDFIINRYREVTISLDYFGDSVINSVFDVGAMLVGFLLARRLPVAVSAAIAIGLEATLAWAIRDNLTINVLMLLHPVDAVRSWQGQ